MKSTETLVRRLRADRRLSSEHLSALEAIPIVIKQVPENTIIVKEGDRPQQCCLLIEGFASRSKVTMSGIRQIVSFHISGDIPDLQSLFLNVMDHDLNTISPATLGFIQHSVLDALFEKHVAIARAFWRETLIEASIFREWILNLGARPAPQRMAHLFVELRQPDGGSRTMRRTDASAPWFDLRPSVQNALRNWGKICFQNGRCSNA
jgi:CRP-like cAMP-binding protein